MSQPRMPVATEAPSGRSPVLLEAHDVFVTYPGGVVAIEDVSLDVRAGEVHCLLGENGAGKSTLIHVLAGLLRPDSGSFLVEGAPVSFDSPSAALKAGVGAVFQHPTSASELTVLENMMLGEGRGLRLDSEGARVALERYSGLLGVTLDAEVLTGRLPLGRRRQFEIVKALWSGSRVLLLDEPTALLAPQDSDEFFRTLLALKGEGLAVVFVTHRLAEALEIGDRITVLRHGRVVGRWGRDELQSAGSRPARERVIEAMFGDEAAVGRGREALTHAERIATGEVGAVSGPAHRGSSGARVAATGRPALEVETLTVEPLRGEVGVHEVSLSAWGGEVVGVAGVDGNGQRELAEALAGQRRAASGDIRVHGVSVVREGVGDRTRRGLRYVTDDRTGEGTVASLSVALNLILKRIGDRPFWRRGRMDAGLIDTNARDLIEQYDILAPGPSTRCGALSGGNLQKVVLARELSSEPSVVVYSRPTYGLDLRTAEAVRARILDSAARGVATVLISADLDEVMGLSDRIVVMSGGRIAGIVDNGPGAERVVAGLMVGADSA